MQNSDFSEMFQSLENRTSSLSSTLFDGQLQFHVKKELQNDPLIEKKLKQSRNKISLRGY